VPTLTDTNFRTKETAWAQLGISVESVVQVKVIKTKRPWALVYCDKTTDTPEISELFLMVHFDQLRKEKPTEIQNEDQMIRYFFGVYGFQKSGNGFDDTQKGLISFVRDSERFFLPDREREDKLFDFLLGKQRGTEVATGDSDMTSVGDSEMTSATGGSNMTSVEDLVPHREVLSSSSSTSNSSGSQKKRKAIEALTDTEYEPSKAVENNSGTDT
jgi:hypothetical protein